MERIVKKAYAKINLTLEILDKRADGYHNIRSVMQKISLCDILTFSFNDSKSITLTCSKDVCLMKENLAYKAAERFLEKYNAKCGKSFGVDIHIEKHIPDKAGLAGGSADCACVLDCLYERFGVVDYTEVEDIAASLGSDINFCLDKYRCALCTDRGVKLEKCKPFLCERILVCVPETGLKTSEIYSAFDADPVLFDDEPTSKLVKCLESADQTEIYPYVCNSFEKICETFCEDISRIKETMLCYGACVSHMSGSGSAVFGIFDDDSKLQKCKADLEKTYPQSYICCTIAE